MEIANPETCGLLAVVLLLLIRQYLVKKLCRTKRNRRTNGYLGERYVKYTRCEPRTLAMFDATYTAVSTKVVQQKRKAYATRPIHDIMGRESLALID